MRSSPVSADVKLEWHTLEDEPMYLTDYDLVIAEDRSRALRDEMKALRLARAARAETTDRPGLFDRLVALASRGAHVHVPHRKVGAAA